eukprot:3545813-Lingulodinium_polyedra.AAC.1
MPEQPVAAAQPAVAEEEDAESMEVMKKLDAARAALGKDIQGSFDDFRTSVLLAAPKDADQGGPYACLCVARGDLAIQWCKRRGLAYSQKLAFGVFGSSKIAGVLGRAWCHKLQHFYNLELLSPAGPDLKYTPKDFSDYQEPI